MNLCKMVVNGIDSHTIHVMGAFSLTHHNKAEVHIPFPTSGGRHPPELRLLCYLQPTLGDGQHSQQTLFLQQNVGIHTRSGLNSGSIKTSL